MITGLENKSEYISWCQSNRFPAMREWARADEPKPILCLGKTYLDDFKRAFHEEDASFHHDLIDGKDLYWDVSADGTLVAVIPFVLNRYGLNRDESLRRFGERIARLMEQA